MIIQGEGTVDISWEELFEIINKKNIFPEGAESILGVPKVNVENQCIEIGYAFSTDCNPEDWVVKPKCLQD